MRKKTTLILFLLTLSIYSLNINVQLTAKENNYRPNSLEFIPHDPIFILSDSGFEVFPGTGIETDPYVIEGYSITTTDSRGISITGTTKYFIISNCYVDVDDYGIYIYDIADGTATVINNTCEYNGYGIYLYNSDFSTIANNTFNYNDRGISLSSSGFSTVTNNTCNNKVEGISLSFSGFSTVANNTCNNNLDGISISFSADSTVTNNTCNNNLNGIYLTFSIGSTVANNTCNNNNDYGILLWSSSSSTVANNTCSNTNHEYGIFFDSSDFCVVTYNLLQENVEYGVYLDDSDNCTIHHNTFVDNNLGGTSQAYDDGTNNTWFDSETLEGNYWSDWSGISSYSIDGSANSVDLYPLDEPTLLPIISEFKLLSLFILLFSIVTFFLTRIISKKTKKET